MTRTLYVKMSGSENIGSTEKLRRLNSYETMQEERTSLRSLSCLERIPLEILAEVLSYVNSPQDVLSVARCSKHLCATLLNPSNVMIWRRARCHCVVPDLPPPLPGWSEPAYAAFIFDSGSCYICHDSTKRKFWSFVARVRLCGKRECREKFLDDYVVVQNRPHPDHPEAGSRFFRERLRYLEIPVANFSGASYHYCLLTDVIKTTMEYEEMTARGDSQDEYLRGLQINIHRQHQALEHAKILYQWSQQWSHKYRATKTSNVDFARKLAIGAGWDLQDLLNTSTYDSLHRSYNTCLETVSAGDVCLLIAKIDAEILSQTENKERRQKVHAQQARRDDISRHYDRLVKGKDHPVVPVLAEFRRLPIIKALQDRDDAPLPSDTARPSSAKRTQSSRILESELKRSKLIGGMIDSDLKKWASTALVALDSTLGQPNWKCSSTKSLHPAEQVTARFICTLCSKLPKKGATAESLNFREACAHLCVQYPKKAAAKQEWRADQFVPDQKAINVLSQAVSLLGLEAENRETEDKIKLVGPIFLCKSCDSSIVMNFQRLAGHCHRHDAMQVGLMSLAEVPTLGIDQQPYDAGSFAKYTTRTNEAKEMRQMKVFGCRHCQDRRPELAIARPPRNDDNRWQRRFTFNGLVSHAKEKHRIFPLGDEDFFRDALTVTGEE